MVYGAQKKKQDSTVALLDFLTTKPMTFSVSRESLHCSTRQQSKRKERSRPREVLCIYGQSVLYCLTSLMSSYK